MKIAVISGSVRIGRQSHKAATFVAETLKVHGQDADLIDLAETDLPIMEERVHLHPQLPEAVRAVSERLSAADAIILVSPEYHGSFSGVLKNALDYYSAELRKKPIGIVATSGGNMGGVNAAAHLQMLILGIGAYGLPFKLLVPEVQKAFDEQNNPVNERTLQSANRFLDEFIWFAEAISDKKRLTAPVK